MTETYFGLKLNSFTITKEEKQQGQAQYSYLELWSRYDTGVKSRPDQSLSRVSLSSILDNVLLEHCRLKTTILYSSLCWTNTFTLDNFLTLRVNWRFDHLNSQEQLCNSKFIKILDLLFKSIFWCKNFWRDMSVILHLYKIKEEWGCLFHATSIHQLQLFSLGLDLLLPLNIQWAPGDDGL